MAQKTANKRRRGEASQPPRPRQYNAERFLSAYHEDRYEELTTRKLWPEKEFRIDPNGKYKGIVGIFEKRKWGVLLKPELKIHGDIVREFYANSLPAEGEEFSFTTFVRGRTIHFDRDAINKFLGQPLELGEDEMCAFHVKQARGDWDLEKIRKAIMQPGKDYDYSSSTKKPFRAQKADMNVPAQVILNLILYNIRPKSHLSSTTLDVTPLIYYILSDQQVDIARVIAKELKTVALNGVIGAKCLLSFPGLIMGLCKKAKVALPSHGFEKIKNPINDTYIYRHNEKKQGDQPESSNARRRRASYAPRQTHSSNLDPQLLHHLSHIEDQNAANHRANTYIHDCLYQMHLHSGVPAEVMNPDQYSTHVAWPGDRPVPYGGGDGSENEEEGDGYENDEEGGEEEGSDNDSVASANTSDATQSDDE